MATSLFYNKSEMKNSIPSILLDSGSDIEKKANLLFDQISGLKSPSSSMGTVSKVSTAEEPKHSSFAPTPTDFPEREEDYNWRTSKINISGMNTFSDSISSS